MKNEGSVVSEMLPQVKIASNFKALDEEQLDVDEGDYVVVLGDAGSGRLQSYPSTHFKHTFMHHNSAYSYISIHIDISVVAAYI